MNRKNTTFKTFIIATLLVCTTLLVFSGCAVKNPILGTWSDSVNTIILKPEGECIATINFPNTGIETIKGTYQINLNTFILSDGNGNYYFKWDIRGNILFLAFNGDESMSLMLTKIQDAETE